MSADEWYFIVASFELDSASLYIYEEDGTLALSVTKTFTVCESFMNYDAWVSSPDRAVTGTIDNLSIWTKALSSDDAQDLFDAQ